MAAIQSRIIKDYIHFPNNVSVSTSFPLRTRDSTSKAVPVPTYESNHWVMHAPKGNGDAEADQRHRMQYESVYLPGAFTHNIHMSFFFI